MNLTLSERKTQKNLVETRTLLLQIPTNCIISAKPASMADLEEGNAMNGHFYKPQTPQGGCCVPLSEFCLDCSPGPLKTGTFREETCETLHCLEPL